MEVLNPSTSAVSDDQGPETVARQEWSPPGIQWARRGMKVAPDGVNIDFIDFVKKVDSAPERGVLSANLD